MRHIAFAPFCIDKRFGVAESEYKMPKLSLRLCVIKKHI
jgi:hypothetical protein